MLAHCACDGGKQARSPRRARRKPLKPLRGECRAISGVTVVTTLVCYLHTAHETTGASGARHSLRPLLGEGGRFEVKTRADTRRDREAVSCRHCEERSDEAIHSSLLLPHGLLRFARNDGPLGYLKIDSLTPLVGSKTRAARIDARPARSSTTRRALAGSACAGRAREAFPASCLR
jgi:hypothetical protein